jgi:hypothetical protein
MILSIVLICSPIFFPNLGDDIVVTINKPAQTPEVRFGYFYGYIIDQSEARVGSECTLNAIIIRMQVRNLVDTCHYDRSVINQAAGRYVFKKVTTATCYVN